MSDYRVYVIGSDGHFIEAIQLNCQDDTAAIESAKQFIDGSGIAGLPGSIPAPKTIWDA